MQRVEEIVVGVVCVCVVQLGAGRGGALRLARQRAARHQRAQLAAGRCGHRHSSDTHLH